MNKFISLYILLVVLFSAFSMKILTYNQDDNVEAAGAVAQGFSFAKGMSKLTICSF